MDAIADSKRRLTERATELKQTEPNFARFMAAAVASVDADDLKPSATEAFEALLRKAYTRLGKREGKPHRVYDFPPEKPGDPDQLEIFSADTPFIVDSVLAAIRAKGGTIRLIAHPVLHLDPESYRLLDGPAPGATAESLLLVQLEPLPSAEARAALIAEIDGTLTDVVRATRAWQPMLDRLRQVKADWTAHPPNAPAPLVTEAENFLDWLAEHNFTFLGIREYRLEGDGADAKFVPLATPGLGLLEDKDLRFLRAGTAYVEMTDQHRQFIAEPDPLMVTKANVRTRVHRRVYMDYIGIKLFGEGGAVTGELRVLGLFTSRALATAHTEVPLLRRKVSEVMRRSGADLASHMGKALMAALESYPRDEMFQIGEDRLYEFAREIATLPERPRVRVLPRIDRFDNFVSILVYVPRDRYSSEVRERIGVYLAKIYEGRVSAYYPHFPEGDLTRVHFIIGRDGGRTPQPRRDELEAEIGRLILTFGDRLEGAAGVTRNIVPWKAAFSAAYQSRNSAADALGDIDVLAQLEGATSLALKLYARGDTDGAFGLKVYHRERPIPLSDRVPMLENFGFRVIDERTYTVTPKDLPQSFIHDMVLDAAGITPADFAARAPLVEEAILAVWQSEAESDGLNALTLRAGLGWAEIAILRGLVHYLTQIGSTWSRPYLTQVVNLHPEVATALVGLFRAQLDLGFAGNRDKAVGGAHEAITAALDATASLDEDRIIRRLTNLVDAAGAHQRLPARRRWDRRPALAIKFDCSKVEGLPEPKPFREIFVYSPRVEGLHLRFGPIARGGIRWSDRPEDFRTEVLGLVKAQQVKNAIIVPVGAKGAFVPRMLPVGADRDAVLKEGTACYIIFIQTLLDVTDNLDGDMVVPPPDVRRRDGDDPYLVVAADKGTATFSIPPTPSPPNRGYWLGDAFASGGSNGYDHKKMGITARGAWEAIKRHFREMNRDIQTGPLSVVGVGDMSGDVFGNGMLLSPEIRLIAAFDHRDIFIDPEPDQRASLGERQRLFALPRSSWQDYNKELLSKGGGIFSRGLKTVPLSPEARAALGLGARTPSPRREVMSAILRARVDLLWFGGIGTYLRATGETDAEVGDRANDAVRIAGAEVTAKVVGEGANLAVTQRAPRRIRPQGRPHRHRRDRQFGRRQRLRHRGQRQDRTRQRRPRQHARPRWTQRFPRRNDRRGSGALFAEQLSADAGALARRTSRGSRRCPSTGP